MGIQRCKAAVDGQLVTHGDGVPADVRCVPAPLVRIIIRWNKDNQTERKNETTSPRLPLSIPETGPFRRGKVGSGRRKAKPDKEGMPSQRRLVDSGQ